MSIRGITFSKQIVTSNDDSHIYKVLLGGRKGRTSGCTITHGTDEIYITRGYFFASNRLVEISSLESVSTPTVLSGTTYCRLVFEIDLTQTNTNEEFNQGAFKVLTSQSDYPEVTQEDLENGGNVYQLPFVKFTKTVSGIGTFTVELEEIKYLTGDTTLYVSASGSDSSGDGTEESPFESIQYALDSLPKNLNDYAVTVNVAGGTYTEDVIISGFYGGTLNFNFGICSVKTLSVYEANVIMNGTQLSFAAAGATYGLYCHRGANVICQLPIIVSGAKNGVYAVFGSCFSANSNVTVNSCTHAVSAMHTANVYIRSLAGTLNNNAVQASAGFVSLGSIATSMASTVYLTSYGGRIYTGAQANVAFY